MLRRSESLLLGALIALTLVIAAPAPGRVATHTVGRGLLGAMETDGTASILVAGDSTGDEADEWVYRLGLALEVRYPEFTVYYRLWDRKRRAWPSEPEVLQYGTSPGAVLDIWNLSVSGAGVNYGRGYLPSAVRQLRPDLVFLSYGHNEGAETDRFRWSMQSLVDELRLESPSTEIALIAQNPSLGDSYQGQRRDELAFLSSRDGVDFIDVYNAFEATGNPAAYLLDDGIHPNGAGQSLWLQAILDRLGGVAASTSQPDMDGPAAIRNGDFSVFRKGVPAGWTLTNARLARTSSPVEPPQRYALRLTQTGGPASFAHPLDAKWLRGKWVTVAVRMFVPSQANDQQVGRVGVVDDRTAPEASIQRQSGIHGSYYWEIVSRVISPRATKASIVVSLNQQAGSATVVVERVVAVVGTRVQLGAVPEPPAPRPLGDD